MNEIQTQRLKILPMSLDELQSLIDKYRDEVPELSQAYSEMLDNCGRHPDKYLWYTSWKFCRDGQAIGYAGFKGLRDDGCVEIGYGVDEGFEGHGYATEGVKALCGWAISQSQVSRVEAETTTDNAASIRVLQKCGFTTTGETGEEGPRYALTEARR